MGRIVLPRGARTLRIMWVALSSLMSLMDPGLAGPHDG